MRIKNDTVLKNSSLVNIGESYILISIGEESYDKTFVQNKKLDYMRIINLKVFNRNGQLIHDPMYIRLKIATFNLPNPQLKSAGAAKTKSS